MSSFFSYHPGRRLSSREALEHPFLAVDCFPLLGLCREEAESGGGVEGEGSAANCPKRGSAANRSKHCYQEWWGSLYTPANATSGACVP